jgi:uncharacterized glyoxalase superfamily protein PhnB
MLSNRSMPEAGVIPVLAYSNLREAADWLCLAFGFSPSLWIGDHRVQLEAGNGAIVLTRIAQPMPVTRGQSIMVRVEDADSHYERARSAGAEIIDAPVTYPYGERQYSCRDIEGHAWTFSQSIADVDPKTWGGSPSGAGGSTTSL